MDMNTGTTSRAFFSQLQHMTLKDSSHIATLVSQAGEALFELHSIATALEEGKKSFLAKLTLEYMDNGVATAKPGSTRGMPISQAENRALGDPRYEEYLKNMVEARRKANLERVKYDMGQVYIDMLRTNAANTRSEMNMNRG
jgi:NADP-dependent 3-hydroxy acid dehydrogenase YdfG